MDRRLYFCVGTCERHVNVLSSSFAVSANSVFVFLQSTLPRSSGLVKHKCSQCHRSYTSVYTLRIHEATHRGRYPYWCKVCGKGFQATSHLRGHMAQHTGVAEFKCDICGRQYRYQCDYKKHMKQHSKESLKYQQLG